MPTANYVMIDGKAYSPRHPLAIAHQEAQINAEYALSGRFPPSDHTQTPLKTSKRLKQSQRPLMNRLETEFYGVLKSRSYVNIRPQAKTYRIANGLRYTPDFTAIVQGCEVAWEVKGKWVDGDSFPKLKMAAAAWPEINWWLAWKDSGQWKEQRILP